MRPIAPAQSKGHRDGQREHVLKGGVEDWVATVSLFIAILKAALKKVVVKHLGEGFGERVHLRKI